MPDLDLHLPARRIPLVDGDPTVAGAFDHATTLAVAAAGTRVIFGVAPAGRAIVDAARTEAADLTVAPIRRAASSRAAKQPAMPLLVPRCDRGPGVGCSR